MRICIDPGHGGYDAGACSGGRQEKDYTLRLGLRVAEIVRAQGHEPVLTRTTDTALGATVAADLAARCRIGSGCDAMLSIHLNSAAVVGTGLEVLFEVESNRVLAQAVLDELLQVAPAKNRGVKVAKLGALPNNGRAVLAEMGFINNPDDVATLDAHFEGYARALARGVMTALGLVYDEEKEDDDMVRYATVKDIPLWGQAVVDKLIKAGALAAPADGKINLSEDMLRVLVFNDRMGLYK